MNEGERSSRGNENDLLERVAKAQQLVRAHLPPNTSLADELIAERREAARHE